MNSKLGQYLLYRIIKLYTDNGRDIKLYQSNNDNGFCLSVGRHNNTEALWSCPKGFYKSDTRSLFKFHTKKKYNKSYFQTIMLGNFYAWSLLRFKLKDSVL